MPTSALDVVGPSFLAVVGAGLGTAVLWFAAVVVVEAIVLTSMQWASFGRSLRASLAMNALTTVVGFFLVGALLALPPAVWVAGAFVASVLLEWGVLERIKRLPKRRSLVVSLVANVVSYVPLALILFPILRQF